MDFIKSLELDLIAGKEIPQFKAGDTVTVNYKNSAGVARPAVTNTGSGTVDDVKIKAAPPLPTLANISQSTSAQSFTPELLCGGKPGADGLQ